MPIEGVNANSLAFVTKVLETGGVGRVTGRDLTLAPGQGLRLIERGAFGISTLPMIFGSMVLRQPENPRKTGRLTVPTITAYADRLCGPAINGSVTYGTSACVAIFNSTDQCISSITVGVKPDDRHGNAWPGIAA